MYNSRNNCKQSPMVFKCMAYGGAVRHSQSARTDMLCKAMCGLLETTPFCMSLPLQCHYAPQTSHQQSAAVGLRRWPTTQSSGHPSTTSPDLREPRRGRPLVAHTGALQCLAPELLLVVLILENEHAVFRDTRSEQNCDTPLQHLLESSHLCPLILQPDPSGSAW